MDLARPCSWQPVGWAYTSEEALLSSPGILHRITRRVCGLRFGKKIRFSNELSSPWQAVIPSHAQ
jgi:hypothetical protein